MPINSAYGRSQNQIHIHLTCLRKMCITSRKLKEGLLAMVGALAKYIITPPRVGMEGHNRESVESLLDKRCEDI